MLHFETMDTRLADDIYTYALKLSGSSASAQDITVSG